MQLIRVASFAHIKSDQATCGGITENNNTYFVNPGYPGTWTGGSG